MLICIETHRTYDFLGGGGSRPPIPPLDPHLSEDSNQSAHSLSLIIALVFCLKNIGPLAIHRVPIKDCAHR